MNIPKPLQRSLTAEIDPAFSLRARFIFEAVVALRPHRVLDMGCGRGYYTHSLTFFPFIRKIDAVDINGHYLKAAKEHCTDTRIFFHQADIYSLPFPDNTFDCIIFSEVLEHIPNEKKALGELRRVLKKNGTLLVTVPNQDFPFLWDPLNWLLMKLFHTHVDKNIWWLAGIWADHDRLYSKNNLVRVLVRNGFAVREEPRPVIRWSWPCSHFFLYGIGKNIVEHMPGGNTFSRFDFEKPRRLARALASFVALPSRFLDGIFPSTHISVGLCVLAAKA